jgi:DNA helicase-2/ATP-dependent DNA helicase PcrA
MLERLNKMVSGYVRELTIGTFHAICARILRQDGKAINLSPRFVIYDNDDQISLIKRAIADIELDPGQHSPQAISSAISAAKSQMKSPQDYLQYDGSYFERVVGRVYERYQQLLEQSTALDFDDLLLKTVWLFKQKPEVLKKYQSRYLHIMVDEFQDTNLVQYELVRQLAAKHKNICVVGDPDQSIYSWRSADLRNILNFEKDYPDAKLVYLEQGYRTTKKILEAAAAIISANRERKPINLWTENETGEQISLVETYNQQEEAQFVVSEIERLVDRGEARLGDCAVMYRTNAQSRALEEIFIRYGTLYKLVAGTRFYERREVKDIIAYMRIIQNPGDGVSLLRVINVPQRGIGKRSTGELTIWAKSKELSLYKALELLADDERKKPPFNSRAVKLLSGFYQIIKEFVDKSCRLDLVGLFDLVVDRTGYREYLLKSQDGEERWENILELRTVAQQYRDLEPDEGLTAFLEGVALVSDVDGLDETQDTVTLITLHQAKGLEFPIVFIVGAEEGILPHFRSLDDPAQMEEERRLCYVGVTRAKNKLYLVRALRRNLMGGTTANEASRFLKDIPRHLVFSGDLWSGEESQLTGRLSSWDESQVPPVSISELKSGDRVRHNQFGEGVVMGCQSPD